MDKFERAIRNAQSKYSPNELVMIDSRIRKLAKEHYKYGKKMPLCIGKAHGIQMVLYYIYDIDVSETYVWSIIEEMQKEAEYEN